MANTMISLLLILMFLPNLALAGTRVTGCAHSGPIATPSEVASAADEAADSIIEAVREMGEDLSANQKSILGSIDSNFEVQNAMLRDLLAGLGMSQQKSQNVRDYGKNSMAYGMENEESSDLGSKVNIGISATEKLERKFVGYFNDHVRKYETGMGANQHLQEKNIELVSPEMFFPTDNKLSSDYLSNARFMITNIVDPFPTYKLPEKFKNEGDRLGYEAQRKVKYSRLSMPVVALSRVVSAYAPTIELGDWSEAMHERMGDEDPKGIDDEGRISVMEYIDTQVDMRFANNDWISGSEGIHGKSQTGLLREIAMMESIGMEMQKRQMRNLQMATALLAQSVAMDVDNTVNAELNGMYNRIITNFNE